MKIGRKSAATAIITAALAFGGAAVKPQQIRINEALPSNAISHHNDSYATPDWIKLYNGGNEGVNLRGYGIYDKNDFSKAWVFPDTVIEAGKTLRIYADKKTRRKDDIWTLESSGWGIYQNAFRDGYNFTYVKVSGDFEMYVEITSIEPVPGRSPHCGLLAKESPDEGSLFVGMFYMNVHLKNIYWHTYRDSINRYPKYSKVNFKNQNKSAWLRMKRVGDTVYSYCEDGTGYVLQQHSNYFPKKDVFIGIAAASNNDTVLSKFSFRNFRINGKQCEMATLRLVEINTKISGRLYKSQEMHTNFKLSSKGETLYLWDASGNLIDTLRFPALPSDMSFLRMPAGSDTMRYCKYGTDETDIGIGTIYEGIQAPPVLLPAGGWHKTKQSAKIINSDSADAIYYTSDGTAPNQYMKPYSGETIQIHKNKVIRVQAHKKDKYPSRLICKTFFIDEESPLPVISISTDYNKLKNTKKTGMFDRIFSEIIVDVNVEYYDKDKRLVYESPLEMKIVGHGVARGHEQPSLRLDVRKHKGSRTFDYKFFGKNSLKKYETLRLRNSSGDWNDTYSRDAIVSILAERIPSQIAASYQPVLSFLNGKFFGLYNLREHINESFIAEKYDIPEDSVNVLKNFNEITGGSVNHFFRFLDTLYNYTNIIEDSALSFINRHLDIANLFDYTILSLYISNFDWPFNNLLQWQSNVHDGKWRFICNDFDWSFAQDGYVTNVENDGVQRFFNKKDENGYHYAKMVSRVLENDKMKNLFINRSADLLNSVFIPSALIQLVDSVSNIIEPVVERQRRLRKDCMENRETSILSMIDFAKRRPEAFREDIVEVFGLSGISRLTVRANIPENISIRINSISVDTSYFSGLYFNDVPVEIEVIGGSNDNFIGWSDKTLGTKRKITITLTDSLTLMAIFDQPENYSSLVINEIMYKPANKNDCGDWFEIYNPNDKPVDISGYTIKDEKDEHSWQLPQGTQIEAKGFLIIANDIDKFFDVYPVVNNVVGGFDFGFGKKDQIRIYDNAGRLIDSVSYTNKSPWPEDAYGTGYTIELISYQKDNNKGENWRTSGKALGTPGVNDATSDTFTNKNYSPKSKLYIYPIPADKYITLEFTSSTSTQSILTIYDSQGNLMRQPETINIYTGLNYHKVNVHNYPSGSYTVVLSFNGELLTQRLMIVR